MQFAQKSEREQPSCLELPSAISDTAMQGMHTAAPSMSTVKKGTNKELLDMYKVSHQANQLTEMATPINTMWLKPFKVMILWIKQRLLH